MQSSLGCSLCRDLDWLTRRRSQGGQLAALCYPAQVVSLIISDVVGDPLPSIASGPTVATGEVCLRACLLHVQLTCVPACGLACLLTAKHWCCSAVASAAHATAILSKHGLLDVVPSSVHQVLREFQPSLGTNLASNLLIGNNQLALTGAAHHRTRTP